MMGAIGVSVVNAAWGHGGSCRGDRQEVTRPFPGIAWRRDWTPPAGTGWALSARRRFVLGKQPHPVPHIAWQFRAGNGGDYLVIRVIKRGGISPEPCIDGLAAILETAAIVVSHRLLSFFRLAIRMTKKARPTNDITD